MIVGRRRCGVIEILEQTREPREIVPCFLFVLEMIRSDRNVINLVEGQFLSIERGGNINAVKRVLLQVDHVDK